MKIIVKNPNATDTEKARQELDIPQKVKVLVHQPDLRVDPVDADLVIDSRKTIDCMEKMSQKVWEHISTGELFTHLFNLLMKDTDTRIPLTIKEFVEDYDVGVIHGAGLIVMLVEARFENKKRVFVRTPEDHMHPKMQRMLMSVIFEIEKI